MNRSQFATSLKNWFVTGAAVLLIILASGYDVLAQTVDPTPNVNDPANVVNCEGTLTTVDFNGTTANTNYLWTNDNTAIGLPASGSNDISFTPQISTNVAQTATVTVTPQAYVTEGYVWGSVNESGTLTLNAPAGKVFTNVAFASYGTPSGSDGNYTIGACNAATSSSVISGLAIGNSTMTVVANNATFGDPCTTSSKALAVKLGYGVSVTGIPQNFTITVNPSASISNLADTICTGTAFNFATGSADIVPSNTTYAWTVVNNTNITGETAQSTNSSAISQTLFNLSSVDQIAVYTVTPTSGAAACVGVPFTYNVTVTPLPTTISTAGSTTFCDGGSVTLIAPVAPIQMSYGYQWNLNGSPIAGATAISYIAVASGSYTVTVTNNVGCSATSLAVVVTENTLPTVAAITGTTTICAGSTTTLASTTTSGIWSSSNNAIATVNAITGLVTGVSAGTTQVSYAITNANGCTNTASVTVFVNALPTPSISSTGSTACLGTTINLTANGGATYSWSNGSTNATIAVTAANVYTVTATSAEGCTATASETVVFNANPSVTISANGPTVFCAGGSLTLTATGGSNYIWSNGTFGATVTVNQSGNYYVMVTNASGCTTQSALVNVTVNSVPVVAAITGSNTVCEGGNILLSSATIGGTWSIANNFIANIDGAGNVTGLNAGTTTISYTVSTNGCTATTTAQLNVLNNPVTPSLTASGATSVCPGSTVVLFASNGANYQWNTGATTPFVVASQSGTYTVTVTGINGCSATSLPVNVFIGDNTNPVITAPLNVTVTPNLGCEAIGVTLGLPITSDNCGVATVSNDAPAIYPIGTTTVTWTVTDASGNVATATQLVTVVDQTAPSAFAPANVTVASNSNCEAINVELGMPNATDNCTNNLVVSNNAPTTYPLGTTIVTWTITDAAGNTTTVDQTVTVVDQTAPVVLLANTSLILDANGNATIDFAALDNGSYDNCGIASTELSQSTFDCSQAGKNFITVYVTDNSGNQSSAVVMVTVIASDACGGDNWDGPSVPDAFTPNGNNYNDTWVIPGLEGYNTKEMTVYSRYGSLVHYSSVYNNDWDGTLLNTGTPVPDGTYYYILKLDGGKQLNGYVYINRVKQ